MDSSLASPDMKSSDPSSWTGQDYSSGGNGHGSISPPLHTPQTVSGGGILKNYHGAPKKVTRDGQPPKRRGPKPDSRPAQTRRQELNRQAQRTHRERKEQYIKALEAEMSRLRESYGNDTVTMRNTLDQHRSVLAEMQIENEILKDILVSQGINFQAELDHRRASLAMQSQSDSLIQPTAESRSGGYGQLSPTNLSAPSQTPPVLLRQCSNGTQSNISRPSPGLGTFHGNSTAEPGISETLIKRDSPEISDMPGIFERDQQLGVDFILSLEATCRDHEEYLVRRSVDSPDNPEEAQFSGHALMATCPPPTHISTVPAQMGGLQPTYPHQLPVVPLDMLNSLLNLSRQLAGQGHMDGGQVTPIMALQLLKSHPEYLLLTEEDIRGMIQSVRGRVRCYGFGAVMEDFELQDAIRKMFASKFNFFPAVHPAPEDLGADDL